MNIGDEISLEKIIYALKDENINLSIQLENRTQDISGLEERANDVERLEETIKNYQTENDYLKKKNEENERLYLEAEELRIENRILSQKIDKYDEEKELKAIESESLSNDIKRKENEIVILKNEIEEMTKNTKGALTDKINSLEADKAEMTKTNKNLIYIIEDLKSKNSNSDKHIEKLREEIRHLNDIITKDKIDTYMQTDNSSFSNNIIDLAYNIKLISSPQSILNYQSLEKMVLYYYNQHNTTNQMLDDKTKQCNLLLALQKENVKTMENVENHKKHINELTSKIKDYDKVKEDLEKLKKEKEVIMGETQKNKYLEKDINELKEKIKQYEDEIQTKKKTLDIINEGTFKIEEEKTLLMNKLKDFDKVKEKDASTGIYLVRDYFSKTASLMDELCRFMRNDEDRKSVV